MELLFRHLIFPTELLLETHFSPIPDVAAVVVVVAAALRIQEEFPQLRSKLANSFQCLVLTRSTFLLNEPN